MALIANALAYAAVQALNGIGGVDDLAHRPRKGEERDDLRPVAPPALRHRRKASTPYAVLEVAQRLFRSLGMVCLVDGLERLGQRLAVLPGSQLDRVAN